MVGCRIAICDSQLQIFNQRQQLIVSFQKFRTSRFIAFDTVLELYTAFCGSTSTVQQCRYRLYEVMTRCIRQFFLLFWIVKILKFYLKFMNISRHSSHQSLISSICCTLPGRIAWTSTALTPSFTNTHWLLSKAISLVNHSLT